MSVKADGLTVFLEDDLTVAASSVGLPLTGILATPPPVKVELFVEDAQIRIRQDSTDPTSTVGEIINPFDRMTLRSVEAMYKWRAIRTGGTSATVHYRFYR